MEAQNPEFTTDEDEEEEEEEEGEPEAELPKIYIPPQPSPILCGFYSKPDTFWLSVVSLCDHKQFRA